MKKVDALVKKVEYFEKLAVYSDRSSFLKKIAQDLDYDSGKYIIRQISDLLSGVNVDSVLLRMIQEALIYNNFDKAKLGNAVIQTASRMTSLTGSEMSEVDRNVVNELMRLGKQLASNPESTSNKFSIYDEPETPSSSKQVAQVYYPRIDKEEQRALSKITTIKGIGTGLPLKIDGLLGPETRKSLDAFKKMFGIKSDSQALAYATVFLENDEFR